MRPRTGLPWEPRGAYLEEGSCVVYDVEEAPFDLRSKRVMVRVALRLERLDYAIEGFGLGGERHAWALVVPFAPGIRKRERDEAEWRLGSIVSEVWTEVWGDGPFFPTRSAIAR